MWPRKQRSFIPKVNEEESPDDDVRKRLSSVDKKPPPTVHIQWRRGAGGRAGEEAVMAEGCVMMVGVVHW